jgi:hypothetical protein
VRIGNLVSAPKIKSLMAGWMLIQSQLRQPQSATLLLDALANLKKTDSVDRARTDEGLVTFAALRSARERRSGRHDPA